MLAGPSGPSESQRQAAVKAVTPSYRPAPERSYTPRQNNAFGPRPTSPRAYRRDYRETARREGRSGFPAEGRLRPGVNYGNNPQVGRLSRETGGVEYKAPGQLPLGNRPRAV